VKLARSEASEVGSSLETLFGRRSGGSVRAAGLGSESDCAGLNGSMATIEGERSKPKGGRWGRLPGDT